MKQGEQGQTEGCQRCDGSRMDLRQGKCSGEEVAWDRLCQRSISDLISNSLGDLGESGRVSKLIL